MRITIVGVGRIKEKYFTMAIEEYAKRLSRYCKLNIIEVPDEKTPDGASEAMEEQIKKLEAERILKNVKEDAFCIALAIEGRMYSSEELADKLNSLGVSGESNLVLGLHKSVMDRADMALSFSRMTFPHQLMRVVLLEQIYRSYRIIMGEPYHK